MRTIFLLTGEPPAYPIQKEEQPGQNFWFFTSFPFPSVPNCTRKPCLGTDRSHWSGRQHIYKTSVEHRRAFSGWCCSRLVIQHCRQLPPNNRLTIISPESITFNQIQLSKEYSVAKLWENLNFLWLRKFQNSISSQLAWCALFLQLSISGPWLHRNRWGRGGEGEPLTNTDAYIPPSEVLV